MYAVTDSKNIAKITVADGEKIVGVGASDKYIVVGTESGKLYKTDNVAVTAETNGEEISIAAEDKISEPLRNIEFTDEDTFVTLGNTKWYNGKAVNSTPTDNPIKPTVSPTTAPTEIPVKPTTHQRKIRLSQQRHQRKIRLSQQWLRLMIRQNRQQHRLRHQPKDRHLIRQVTV